MSASHSATSLESWLSQRSGPWNRLSKRDYISFFANWRRVFEPEFELRRPDASGFLAMAELDARLPVDAVLFCEPGYRHLPSGTGHQFYAFAVSELQSVNRELFNAHDVTVADSKLRFCCFYTHEIGALSEPTFWLAHFGGAA